MKRILFLTLLLVSIPAWSTVTSQNFSVSYSCSGTTGPFPFTFPINDPTALTVTQNGTTLANPTNYTTVPVNNNYGNGGSVTLILACPGGQTLVITRNTPLTQGNSFYDNMPSPMKTFEKSLDKLTEITQEQSTPGCGSNGSNGISCIGNIGGSSITSASPTCSSTNPYMLFSGLCGSGSFDGSAFLPLIGGTVTGNLGVSGTISNGSGQPPTLPSTTPTGNQAISVNSLAAGLLNANFQFTNGYVNPKAYGASGSASTTSASCTSSSNVVSLGSAIDLTNGQGINLLHCGIAPAATAPSASVIVIGTTGSTTYQYCVASIDANGGESTCGATIQTTTGAATRGATNGFGEITNYNRILITPVGAAAVAYAIYQKPSNILLGISNMPAKCQTWKASFAYQAGMCITPPIPNGFFYVISTPGTSGGSAPTFSTTVGNSVTDNTAIWSTQAFTFADDGQTTWDVATPPSYVSPLTVSSVAPTSYLNDSLVTTIASGGGTTSLILATNAGASRSTTIYHDDTAAIQAAVNAATALETQINPGIFTSTLPHIWFPFGVYYISSPINIGGHQGMNIQGMESVIIQTNAFVNVLNASSAYQLTVDRIQLVSGRNQLVYSNANADQSKVEITNSQFFAAQGYSIFTLGTGSTDYHTSALIKVDACHFTNNTSIAFSNVDFFHFDRNWTEWTTSSIVNGYGRELFTNFSGNMYFDSPVFVTAAGNNNGKPLDLHYVDNYGTGFLSNGTRFGREFGGLPIVYNYAQYFLPSAFNFNTISIRNSVELGSGAGASTLGQNHSGAVRLVGGIPNQIIFDGNWNVALSPYISIDSAFDVPLQVAPAIQAAGTTGLVNIDIQVGQNQVQQGGSYTAFLNSDLLGFYYTEEWRTTDNIPVSGTWSFGQHLYRNSADSNGNLGWLVTRTGLAAMVVGRTTSYVIGQFVEDPTNNGLFYECTTAGTTAGSAPAYNTGDGSTTTDGTAVFTTHTNWNTAQFVPIGGSYKQSVTFSAGSAAGAGASTPTCTSDVCTNSWGQISMTMGTGTSTGNLFTISQSIASPKNIKCAFQQVDGNALLNIRLQTSSYSSISATAFTPNAPTASTVYSFIYSCGD